MADVFSDAEAYEAYMGRWSRLVAPTFVAWLDLPDGLRWLDVGCGTGALTSAVLEAARPLSVVAVDTSNAFVAAARRALPDERVRVEVADADRLPVAAGAADVVVSALVLNFLPDPVGALREQARAVRADGTVAAYVWDYAEGMQALRLFWQAAAAVDAGCSHLDEATRFPICRPEPLAAAWRDAGLVDVRVEPLDVECSFASFGELWAPFLRGQGPAGSYLDSLDDVGRAEVGEAFAARTLAPDGTVTLGARAWAVRGARDSSAHRRDG